MTSARDKKDAVDARIIDLVLKDIQGEIKAAAETGSGLPKKLNVERLAKSLGFRIQRGQSVERQDIIPVPAFYSDREMRLEVARRLARGQLRKIAASCPVTKEDRARQSQLCNFVAATERDGSKVDYVAAAVLMPTEDFRKWGKRLEWRIGPLADSYAVPQELASIRRDTLRPKDESDD